MRQTCIGASGSSVCVRLVHVRARTWAVAVLLGLLFGRTNPALAATDSRLYATLTTGNLTRQPGPSARSRATADADSLLLVRSRDSALSSSTSSTNLYAETYWTAFANLDVVTLRNAAQTDPQARFAEGMTLLTSGNYDAAESAFALVSQQRHDLNAAVAAQVMLATTLRYQRKWSELRDLSLNSTLSADDKKITSDLERWGRAFAGSEPEVTTIPQRPVVLPLKISSVGTPMIRVQINGKSYDFWLDTGSSMTVVSSTVAEEAKIAPISDDTLTVRTFAGSAPVKAATVGRMEIGSIVLVNSPAVIIDERLMYLRASVASKGIQVDGIIGWDTIRQFDMTMDYSSGKITLKQPTSRGAGGAAPNLTWIGKPMVEARSKAGGMHHFTLDTGAQASFLNVSILDKTGVNTRHSGNRVFGIARTGRQTDRVVPFLRLDVGGRSVELKDVILYNPAMSGLINCDGILGSDVGRFGTLHIDASNGLFSIGDADVGDDAGE